MRVRAKASPPPVENSNRVTPGNVYRVIEVSPNYYRIFDDLGHPDLLPKELFDVVDPTEPDDWITYDVSEEGQRYAGPAAFARRGFFEFVYHEENEAVAIFRNRIARWLYGKD